MDDLDIHVTTEWDHVLTESAWTAAWVCPRDPDGIIWIATKGDNIPHLQAAIQQLLPMIRRVPDSRMLLTHWKGCFSDAELSREWFDSAHDIEMWAMECKKL